MDYLVMEFLEGETLASRPSKGPLPLEQTLKYAIQIADALDKAHRDLKPGNIMITKPDAAVLADQPLAAGRRRKLTSRRLNLVDSFSNIRTLK
jgi:serine/threonine protein kinase